MTDLLDQLAEIEAASRPIDDETAAVLALIAGDPIHREDRRRVVEAILGTARAHNGFIDPNDVRTRLTGAHGLSRVHPPVTGATYQSLTARGVIRKLGWTTSLDTRGRNAGRPARTYELLAWTASAGAA